MKNTSTLTRLFSTLYEAVEVLEVLKVEIYKRAYARAKRSPFFLTIQHAPPRTRNPRRGRYHQQAGFTLCGRYSLAFQIQP